ncbi:MAG TPA: hypothetical protein VFI54_15390 [Solirubrobacteraceae bacterium]|nr:hypothetical protein [Solirubrobacteraceae bacterium]
MNRWTFFATREAAEAELREILHDEPDWKDVVRVVPIELAGRNVSENVGAGRASALHSRVRTRARKAAPRRVGVRASSPRTSSCWCCAISWPCSGGTSGVKGVKTPIPR